MKHKRMILFVSMVMVLSVLLLVGMLYLRAIPPNTIPPNTRAPSAVVRIVTNDSDRGPGSLRQAIADAASGDTITFNADYTITLTGELVLSKNLTIDGQTHQVTVSGNHATRVFNVTAGNVTLAHLTIANGNAQTIDCGPSAAWCGGGIILQNSGVAVTVTHSTLSGDSATSGGSIFNYYGALTVQNTTLTGNSAGVGGSIYNEHGTLTVQNSILSGNAATDGGGIYNDIGTLTVQNSTLVDNSTLAGYGGGIYNSGLLTVNNSTLAGGQALRGGGIYNDIGTLTMQNSTFSGNSAQHGGGIYNYPDGTLHLHNTIMANSLTGGDCYNDGGSVATNDHNLFKSTDSEACGVTNGADGSLTGTDPFLGPLADHGGTQTFSLLPGSPALDAGNDATCLSTDQRGVARPRGIHCDIGAYEY